MRWRRPICSRPGSSMRPPRARSGRLETKRTIPFNQRYKRTTAGSRSPALKALQARYNAARGRVANDRRRLAAAGGGVGALPRHVHEQLEPGAGHRAGRRGKVLLFAADAQTGNWSSWADVKWDDPGVSTDDLLARTVFYKVGHHASHNATLVAAFEKMGIRNWSR